MRLLCALLALSAILACSLDIPPDAPVSRCSPRVGSTPLLIGPCSSWHLPLVAALRGGGEGDGEDRRRKKQRKKKPLLRTFDENDKGGGGGGGRERTRLPPAAQSALKAGRIDSRCG
ncbi:hypothetical protein T484DRAFT_1822832 [Baffinella frigidus]|nr:hypothetical protein T484DRAFT_1822832 [Cryptophyta sp. CCMP2293]